jgi:nitroreductase
MPGSKPDGPQSESQTRPGEDADDAVLERLLNNRWSCRAFLPTPVPRPVIERMFTLAQRSPSWCNTQPWQAIVTSGEATQRFRDGLLDHVAEHGEADAPDYPWPERYDGVYLERRRESGWQLYEAVGVKRGDREASARQARQNFEFFGAPHVAVITIDAAQGVYAAVDGGVYVSTLLLSAESLGLGAIAQAALAGSSSFIREYFEIPDDRKVLVGLSFGYPDRGHVANSYRTARAGLDDVISWAG